MKDVTEIEDLYTLAGEVDPLEKGACEGGMFPSLTS